MKSWLRQLAVLLVGIQLIACANVWREGDTGLSEDEVRREISLLEAPSAASSDGAVQRALQLFYQGGTVYIAEGPGKLGPWYATVPMDFDAFSPGFSPLNGKVRVLFFVLQTDQGTETALILNLYNNGQTAPITKAYVSSPGSTSFGDGSFMGDLDGPLADAFLGNRLIVRSDDVTDNKLADVIQLELSSVDNRSGIEVSLGQISTLVGHQVN